MSIAEGLPNTAGAPRSGQLTTTRLLHRARVQIWRRHTFLLSFPPQSTVGGFGLRFFDLDQEGIVRLYQITVAVDGCPIEVTAGLRLGLDESCSMCCSATSVHQAHDLQPPQERVQ